MFFFFFNDTATTEIYTLSLHDALPISGTTRDAIDLPIEVDGRRLIIVDTAGMRRQSKVTESVEYYTALRSQRAAERADVALVVCDAADGVTAQDLRVAEIGRAHV